MRQTRVTGIVVTTLLLGGCASTGIKFNAEDYKSRVKKIGIVSVMMATRVDYGSGRAGVVYGLPESRYQGYVDRFDKTFAKSFGDRYVPVEQVKAHPGFADFAAAHPTFLSFIIYDSGAPKPTPVKGAPGLSAVSPYSDLFVLTADWRDAPGLVGEAVRAAGLDAGIFVRSNLHGNRNALFSVAGGVMAYNTLTIADQTGKPLMAAGTSLSDILTSQGLPEIKMKNDDLINPEAAEEENLKQFLAYIEGTFQSATP